MRIRRSLGVSGRVALIHHRRAVASITGDKAYDADVIYAEIYRRHSEADLVIPVMFSTIVTR
jgi:hypothetical protein